MKNMLITAKHRLSASVYKSRVRLSAFNKYFRPPAAEMIVSCFGLVSVLTSVCMIVLMSGFTTQFSKQRLVSVSIGIILSNIGLLCPPKFLKSKPMIESPQAWFLMIFLNSLVLVSACAVASVTDNPARAILWITAATMWVILLYKDTAMWFAGMNNSPKMIEVNRDIAAYDQVVEARLLEALMGPVQQTVARRL